MLTHSVAVDVWDVCPTAWLWFSLVAPFSFADLTRTGGVGETYGSEREREKNEIEGEREREKKEKL